MLKENDSVIVSATRTPIGSFMGELSSLSATSLAAISIKNAIEKIKLDPSIIDECIMGNVLSAGLGQAPARQAALTAGLSDNTPCLTINKVCASGIKSVMLAENIIRSGDANIVVAGGMESMSNAPYLLPKARTGYRLGNQEVIDSMIKDGLWDVYNDFHMGSAAELCAKKYGLTREMQDDYTIASYEKAINAQKKGLFNEEICEIEIKTKKGTHSINEDEEPKRVKFEKIRQLKPVFDKEGTVTAANASSINDGAAALIITTVKTAKELGVKPLAKIIVQASTAKAPEWFTTAPKETIETLLKKANLSTKDIDLYELNEAFSVVNLSVGKELEIDPKKVNINGGSIALGHPIGASGARILVTLIHTLKQTHKKLGLACLCNGGGGASGVILESLY